MTVASITTFDYSVVSPPVAMQLKLHGEAIRSSISNTMTSIIAAGRSLSHAKEHLEHGNFGAWVEAEVRIPLRTAQAYMSAAKLADDKGATVALLPPATVYRLAAKAVPPEIVDDVLAKAASGAVVPDREVADLIADARRLQQETARFAKLSPQAMKRAAAAIQKRKASRAEYLEQRKQDLATDAELAAELLDAIGHDAARVVLQSFTRCNDPVDVINALRVAVAA